MITPTPDCTCGHLESVHDAILGCGIFLSWQVDSSTGAVYDPTVRTCGCRAYKPAQSYRPHHIREREMEERTE